MPALLPVRRMKDALMAVCECGHEIQTNQYWPLSKSVYLHTSHSGHKVTLYGFESEAYRRGA